MSTSSNTVTITDNTGLLNTIAFNGTLNYTTGEKCEPPPSITQRGNVWIITLLCDRKGSAPVAVSFTTALNGGAHMYADGQSSGDTPKELNFYFGVTLTPKSGSPVAVDLGQGHYNWANNWWFGSAAAANTGGNKPVLLLSGQNVVLSGSTSAFVLSNLS